MSSRDGQGLPGQGRIAIVGRGMSRKAWPPADGAFWETWALASAPVERAARLFEVHRTCYWPGIGGVFYEKVLAGFGDRLWLRKPQDGLPAARVLPMAEIEAAFGDYLACSIAFMLAAAILARPRRIGLWGCDFKAWEKPEERGSVEYMIGFARGRGIAVEVAEGSALLQAPVYGI